MVSNVVIDANCWSAYVDESVRGDTKGLAISTYETASKLGAIIFDSGLLIRQQYVQGKRGIGEQLFETFFERGVLSGTVRLVAVNPSKDVFKHLQTLGVPRKEHIYFHTACAGGASHLVSEDIDFFDPTLKGKSALHTRRAKKKGKGRVCREFSKTKGITICCMETFVADH